MRDLLTDPEFVQSLSDPDPIRRAQIQMRTPLPKRFYKDVTVGPGEGGHLVLLDGRTVRTPGKAALALPTEAAAKMVADEFAARANDRPGQHASSEARQLRNRRRRAPDRGR